MKQGNSFGAAKTGTPGNLASGGGSKMSTGCLSSQTGAVDEMGEHREKKDQLEGPVGNVSKQD